MRKSEEPERLDRGAAQPAEKPGELFHPDAKRRADRPAVPVFDPFFSRLFDDGTSFFRANDERVRGFASGKR